MLDWIFHLILTKINIVNDDFKVLFSNVNINHTAEADELDKTQDYDLVVWSIVKSFDHKLSEAYICDHSEECGGLDAPDGADTTIQ